jgi:hypothetical protein
MFGSSALVGTAFGALVSTVRMGGRGRYRENT